MATFRMPAYAGLIGRALVRRLSQTTLLAMAFDVGAFAYETHASAASPSG